MADRVELVPLGRTHLARTREWANDPELMRLMDRRQPVSPAEHEAWFASLSRRADCVYFAIELRSDRTHIGNVWLWDVDRRNRKAELRVVVGDRGARGSGLGSEAIDKLCRHAFDSLGLHRIYAYVLGINPRRVWPSNAPALRTRARFEMIAGRRTGSSTATFWLG